MELKIYKLKIKSKLYMLNLNIRATSLKEAGKLAREKFARKYQVFGDEVKISLDPEDLPNHIDEILEVLHG